MQNIDEILPVILHSGIWTAAIFFVFWDMDLFLVCNPIFFSSLGELKELSENFFFPCHQTGGKGKWEAIYWYSSPSSKNKNVSMYPRKYVTVFPNKWENSNVKCCQTITSSTMLKCTTKSLQQCFTAKVLNVLCQQCERYQTEFQKKSIRIFICEMCNNVPNIPKTL